MQHYLEFEKPVAEIERQLTELRAKRPGKEDPQLDKQIRDLEEQAQKELEKTYKGLSPWQKCQVARHPDRPHCRDFINRIFTDQMELAGDRNFGDDLAITGCLARLDDKSVMVIGHEKGYDTKTRLRHNFGMARPEGFRKAIRLMDLANRFRLPVITIVDTPGAYPGMGAEERGQSEAIAQTTSKCLSLRVPLVSLIIGEGGSGGAVALATADRVAMLEHSVYSVISPEGCASILWSDSEKMREAAEALRLTAQDLVKLEVVDRVVAEPMGGAQRDPNSTIFSAGSALQDLLNEVARKRPDTLLQERYEKFMGMGMKGLA